MKQKRCKQPRRVEYTRTFAKSWARYNKAGRRNMHELVEVMTLIFSNAVLPAGPATQACQGYEGATP